MTVNNSNNNNNSNINSSNNNGNRENRDKNLDKNDINNNLEIDTIGPDGQIIKKSKRTYGDGKYLQHL